MSACHLPLCSGFTTPLMGLKQRLTAAHPSLPPENPGSKWPKTSLGCLLDERRLTPEQLALLCRICGEESAAFQQHQRQAGTAGTAASAAAGSGAGRLAVDSACVALFESRSLERLVSCQRVAFQGECHAFMYWLAFQAFVLYGERRGKASGCSRLGSRFSRPLVSARPLLCALKRMASLPRPPQSRLHTSLTSHCLFPPVPPTGGLDEEPPSSEEQARVAGILAEPSAPDYWFCASRDGNREAHYRGPHLGATLVHLLLSGSSEGGGDGSSVAGVARPALKGRPGAAEADAAARQGLLAAIARFRHRVDEELPGMYTFFADASLHITVGAAGIADVCMLLLSLFCGCYVTSFMVLLAVHALPAWHTERNPTPALCTQNVRVALIHFLCITFSD